jgi:hypothetical protein
MIDANAYSLATDWALHEIKAQVRDTERERDFQTSDLLGEAKRYLNDHPEMLLQAEAMIESHTTFANLRRKGQQKR